MAHGLNAMLKRGGNSDGKTGIGSRRIFAPQFKLQVLDSYRNDADCKGNQRATARKYGIHRRQIQKWLQVEGNLRNSVLKSKCVSVSPEARKCGLELALSGSDRQRGDCSAGLAGEGTAALPAALAAVDKRVPDIPQAVQHEWRRGSPDSHTSEDFCFISSPPSPPAPLDFTTHSRPTPPLPHQHLDPAAPIDLSLKPPRRCLVATPSPPVAPVPHTSLPLPTPPAPADPDIWDLSTKSTKRPLEDSTANLSPRPVKLFKPYLDHVIEEQHYPPAASPILTPSPSTPPIIITNLDDQYYHHNNNNNNSYQPDYHVDYALYNDYYYNGGGLHFVREPYVFKNGVGGCMKQRQSYSLDFKLSAIECYYSDAVCRGNQRAVASKFKIHRRQVQKWLKQEDQLRQRVQPLHIVR